GGGEGVGGHDLPQRLLDEFPELHALRAVQDQRARALRVERGGRLPHRLLDQAGHLVLAERDVPAEGVLGAALAGNVEEAVVGHWKVPGWVEGVGVSMGAVYWHGKSLLRAQMER